MKISIFSQPALLMIILSSGVAGCASSTKPSREMIFASAALKAADRSMAERRSPDLFRRAENAYWRATRLYMAREYEGAQKSATDARRLAELSELDAEVKDVTSGGGS